MITGIHALLYSRDADATRVFFRDVLGFRAVDAGEGWLIFALPPAELGIHPGSGKEGPELNLMCDNLERTLKELRAKGVESAGPIRDEGYGLVTALRLPDGGKLGIYEPRHPTALSLSAPKTKRAAAKPVRPRGKRR